MEEYIKEIRKDFPALNQFIKGKSVIYFDNACMTAKPCQVIEAMNEYYFNHPSCHNRAIHRFGKRTSSQYDKARKTTQDFINAKESSEVVFTKNTSEGINIVAHSFPFEKEDCVLTTNQEHNSNFLPWRLLHDKGRIVHKMFLLNDDGTFNLTNFRNMFNSKVKLVSIFHTSHVSGYSLPIEQIIKIAHEHGAYVLVDAAQSAAHQEINVQKLKADFLVFSFHKMLGPTAMGCLYAKKILLEMMNPIFIGGETVDDVDYRSYQLSEGPARFEVGLQNYAGAMGITRALQYLTDIGLENIQKQIYRLNEYITNQIKDMPKVTILGPQDANLRGGIVNFYVEGMDSGELSIILDTAYNIMVRSGVHCCHAWYKSKGIPPSLRVSLYFYNTMGEAEVFVETLRKVTHYYL